MTPQEPKGEQASADAGVEVAMRMLEHSLVAHGSKSEKGRALLHMLSIGRKAFKNDDNATAIMPAELKSALLAPAGEPGPAAGGAEQQGAPPGGAPPG